MTRPDQAKNVDPVTRDHKTPFQLWCKILILIQLISAFVCLSDSLSICPFACLLEYLRNHASKFHQIFCTCYL